jgi:hypothetical protein
MKNDTEDGAAAGQPVRIPLGAEDFLVRYPPGARYRLCVETPVERAWRGRIEGDQIRATHHGTALLFQDRYYEVVLIEVGRAGLIHYNLAPWPDEAIIRQAAELSPATSELAAREKQTARKRAKVGSLLLFATPFLGLLPKRDQLHLEREYGTDSLLATSISAALIGLPAAVFTVFGIAASFGVGFGANTSQDAQRFLLPALYFFAESMLRIWSSFSAGEPAGSLPVVIFAELVRTVLAKRGDS